MTWNDVTGSTPEYPQAGSMVDKKILSSSTKNINLGSFTDSEAYFDAYWNVTSLAHNWYAGENYGFALIPTNETSATSRAAFYGLSDANQNATFIVLYRNTVGLEDYYSYQTVGIGRAGTSYISDYTMQNTLVVPLLSSSSNVMPFSLSLIYNSAYGSYQFTSGSEGIHTTSYANLLLGAGWKLSAQETVVALAVDGITYLVHTDADGTEHYFRYSSAAGGYEDEDGMRLIITGSSSSYTMTDEYGNQKTFTNGYLTRVKDAYGNQINYSYSSGRITKITRKNTGSSETETLAMFDYDEDGNSKTLDCTGGVL